MEQDREFQGRTLEEAVGRALAQLGRQPGEVKYEIVQDGRRGFLGFGARPVRIRVLGGLESSFSSPQTVHAKETRTAGARVGGHQAVSLSQGQANSTGSGRPPRRPSGKSHEDRARAQYARTPPDVEGTMAKLPRTS